MHDQSHFGPDFGFQEHVSSYRPAAKKSDGICIAIAKKGGRERGREICYGAE